MGSELDLSMSRFPGFPMKVRIKDGKVAEVLADVEKVGFISYDDAAFEAALTPFVKAGIKVDYTPWESQGGEDFEGSVFIKKDDLNKALAEGRIVISKNENGELVIE